LSNTGNTSEGKEYIIYIKYGTLRNLSNLYIDLDEKREKILGARIKSEKIGS
jgi:hypothetical protein